MLKTRVIPTMLLKDLTLVKGRGFNSWRRTGTVLPQIRVYNRRQVDELIILDIAATPNDRRPDFDEVRQFAGDCFVPLTVGGGMRSLEDMKEMLRAGADKIALNTICYSNPEIVTKAAQEFGTQCLITSIDARRKDDGTHECYSHCGKQAQGIKPNEWARELEARGAGEILITSIERDGLMQGYDLDLIKSVTNAVKIPVIASGGANDFEDFRLAIQDAGAQAVSAASMFHFTERTPLEGKNYLKEHGVAIRQL